MHPLLQQALEGTICPSTINEYNAERMMEWVRSGGHSDEDCTNSKDCIHRPRDIDIEHAARLVREMPDICECGEHV